MSIPWHLIPALQPAPAEGTFFRRKSIDRYDKLPLGHLAMWGASWYEMDTENRAGAMCHCVVEMDAARRFYLTEMWHSRTDVDSAIQALLQIQEGLHITQLWQDKTPQKSMTYGPKRWFVDPEQYEDGIKDRVQARRVMMNRKIEDQRDYFRITVGPLKDALTIQAAARSLQADLISRTLLLPRKAPWLGGLEAELMQWPATPTSSRVAALGLITAARAQIHPAYPKPATQPPTHGSWMAQ